MLPLDTSIEAKYADGYILSETELEDKYPLPRYQDVEDLDIEGNIIGVHTEEVYDNILRAVINKHPEAEHGPLVQFTVFYKNRRYDIDWTTLPANARPIRFRDGNLSRNTSTGEEKFWWSGCRIGFQYNDETGKNVQEVQELT